MVNEAIREPACTLDGARIELLLNAGLSADTSIAVNQGVDGVGLYRTEISFLLQHRFPSEEEQTQQYRHVLNTYPHQRVVMRTLDIVVISLYLTCRLKKTTHFSVGVVSVLP